MRAPLNRLRAADKLPAKKNLPQTSPAEHKGAKPRILAAR